LRDLENSLRLEYERKLAAVKADAKTVEALNSDLDKRKEKSTRIDPVKAVIDKVMKPSTERRERHSMPQAMEPVHQVAPHSYIGQALGRIDHKGRRDDDPDSSTSDSSSESSSSSSDSSDDESSSSESARRPKKKKSKRSKRSSKGKKNKTTLKPIPPATYDGAVDLRAFHRFITEGTAYVEDGKVSSKKKVFILSHFLKGKAHEFYIREVSGDPYRWRLHDFFTELFNYCFPINFHTKQREKLKRCFQNDKSVRDYVYELNEYWNMIGDVNKRDRVTRLWTGLNAELQRELWKKELNPEVSSFKEVQAAAEIIEIAHSVSIGRDRKAAPCEKSGTGTIISSAATSPKPEEKSKNFRGTRRRDRSLGNKSNDSHGNGQNGSPLWKTGHGNVPGRNNRTKGDNPSPEECERHRTEGRCFLCGDLGHISRQCPKNTHVSSDSPNKPPGVPSFGIHLTGTKTERLHELAEGTSTQDIAFVGAMSWDFGDEAFDGASDPLELDTKAREYPCVWGDLISWRAEELLTGIVYPGDEFGDESQDNERRFCIYQTSDTHNVVIDHVHEGRCVTLYVPRASLEDPEFRIDSWYWNTLGLVCGVDEHWLRTSDRRRSDQHPPMGDPQAERMEWWLNTFCSKLGGSEFNIPARFKCKRYSRMYYEVYDKGLDFRAWVMPRQLQNERWDAGRWYQRNLASAINVICQQLLFVNGDAYLGLERLFPEENSLPPRIELNGVQVPMGTYPALERNSATTRDFKRAIPEPVVGCASSLDR